MYPDFEEEERERATSGAKRGRREEVSVTRSDVFCTRGEGCVFFFRCVWRLMQKYYTFRCVQLLLLFDGRECATVNHLSPKRESTSRVCGSRAAAAESKGAAEFGLVRLFCLCRLRQEDMAHETCARVFECQR